LCIAALVATPLASTYVAHAQNPPANTASTSSAAGAPIALQNPGFEGGFKTVNPQSDAPSGKARISGEVAEGWGDNSDWAPVSVVYARDTVNPHRGAASQRVDVSRVEGGAVQFVQQIPLKKGRVYEASVWLRGRPGQSVTLYLRQAGAPYAVYSTERVALAAEWKEARVLAPATEDGAAFVMVRSIEPQRFWIDDVSLVDVTDAASTGAPIVGNQLSNGSFETARLPAGWSARFEGSQGFRHLDPRPVSDATTAAHGRRSLRADIPAEGNVTIHSPVVQPNYARPHTASVWLRASRPDTPVQLHLEKTELYAHVAAGPQWKKFSLAGTLPFQRWTQLRINVSNREQATTLWIDGAVLEEGTASAAPYTPSAPVEMTLNLDAPGSVVFDREKKPVALSIAGVLPRGAMLSRTVEDLRGRVLRLPPVALPRAEFDLPPMGNQRGMWKMRAQVLAGPAADSKPLSAPVELVWARLPRPKVLAPENSYFGLHVPLSERYVRIGLAVGSKWTRLHDTSMVAKWADAEPQPGQFRFRDEAVTLTRRLGMQILGMLDGAPRWAGTKPREGYWGIWHIPDAPGAPDAWEAYCARVAEHYKGRIDYWEVWNEPWGEWFLGAGGTP
jgi:hypothetical protein